MPITRIPVLATIRDAYAFAFSHLGGVIGLIWLPMVVLTVSGFFTAQRLNAEALDALAGKISPTAGLSLLLMLSSFILTLLLLAMMQVAVLQLAQGVRKQTAVTPFAFGAPERRLFGAFLAFAGAVVVIVGLVMNVALLLLAGAHLPDMTSVALLDLSIYGSIVFAAPRFLVLLPAIAAFEEVPSLRRAWSLSAGNFWRLLAVLVGIFVPIFVLFLVVEAMLLGQGGDMSQISPPQQMIELIKRTRDTLPMISGFGFMVAPLLIALFSGASLSAWRTVQAKSAHALDLEV
jgi:hypothetical protein